MKTFYIALCAGFLVVLGVGVRIKGSPARGRSTPESRPLTLIEQHIALGQVKGRIDHITADPTRKRLIVGAVGNDTVEVIDTFGGTVIHSISGFQGPKTPLYVPDFDKLFVISTGDAKVRIFDAGTYALRKTIDLPGDFEMIRYDPRLKKVYVGWGDPKHNGGIAVIDPHSEERLTTNYDTNGSPESFVIEESGAYIFANVPDAGDVVESINRDTGEIKKFAVEGAKKNVAMALDEDNHRVFTVTRRPPLMEVMDTSSGKLVASLRVTGDCADIFYDKSRKRIYAIGGWGYISVFQQQDPDHYEFLANVPTAPGARTGYFYAKRDLLYVGVQPKGLEPPEIWTYEPQD